jgi:hypothetical protein
LTSTVQEETEGNVGLVPFLVRRSKPDSWAAQFRVARRRVAVDALVNDVLALGETRAVLLAVAGGESSDPTPVRGDVAEDLGAAGPDRLTDDR